jgi:hypothetical protein
MKGIFVKVLKKGTVFTIALSMSVLASFPAYADEVQKDTTIIVENVQEGTAAADIVSQLKVSEEVVQPSYDKNALSEKEQKILEEFNNFLNSEKKIQSSAVTISDIEAFADYAVNRGLIQDTPIERAGITKAIVRGSMYVVATGGEVVGYDLSAALLRHSLDDSPSEYTINRGSKFSNQVKDSTAHKNLINNVKNILKNHTGTSYSQTGSVVMNNTTDLALALNKVSYILGAEKVGGTWNIYVRYHDVYDFEYQKWGNISGLGSAAKTALNNYGNLAQSIGAVVPYDIAIYTLDTY